MVRRLIVDTGVLVEFERDRLDPREILGEDDAAIAAISVAELFVGLARAAGPARARREARIDVLLNSLPVEHYTPDTARAHATLIVEAMRSGRSRGSFDLIIAATAVATRRTVLTTDAAAAFGSLPGVDVRLVSAG